MIKKLYTIKSYLQNAIKTKNYIDLAKEYHVDASTIQRYLRRYHLTKSVDDWTKREIELLKKNYYFNINVYHLFPKRSISSVNHKASRLGLSRHMRKRVYSINHHFFKKWSNKMAYILGFFMSDGNVSYKRSTCSIHLNSKDHYILEIISREMQSNYPILIYKNSSCFRFHNWIIHDDLIKLGCGPRKSLTLKFPYVPKKYLLHFIRGYFDGDGCITFNKPNTIKIKFVATKSFTISLLKKLNLVLGLKIGPIRKHYKIWISQYYSNDARKLCCFMYKNCGDLFLKRKKDRFDNHLIKRKNETSNNF